MGNRRHFPTPGLPNPVATSLALDYDIMDALPSPRCSPAEPFVEQEKCKEDPHQIKQEQEAETLAVNDQNPHDDDGDDPPGPLSPAPSLRQAGPSWCLLLPSLYRTPPAAQRRRFRVNVKNNPNLQIQIEEGTLAIDFARAMRFWTVDGQPRTGFVTSDDEAELIEDADLVIQDDSRFAILRGGAQGEKKHEDEQYIKALNLVYGAMPKQMR